MKMFENMDKGVLTTSDMKKTKYKILYFAMCACMFLWCLIILIPVVWLCLSGFKDASEVYSTSSSFFPKTIKLSKIIDVWNEMKYYQYYINTFIFAGGCVIADVVISGITGYVFSRLKPKGSKTLYNICFALMLLPGNMSTVPVYMLIKNMGLLNSYVPIWMMSAINIFDVFLFKSFFDGISESLIEAAKIDGASNIRIFWKIIIPLSVPIFIVVAVFAFNAQMSSFFWPYLLIQDDTKTVLGVQIYKLKTSAYTIDYQMLALLFSMIPQVIIFAIFQKQIVGGVNVGGVKG